MKLTTIGTARGVAASLILPAALACSDGAGPSSSLPLKAVDQLTPSKWRNTRRPANSAGSVKCRR